MLFHDTAVEVEFIKRYKRFFADVRHENEIVTAHVPNTGSLKTCIFEGGRAVITKNDDPKRKLKATLQFLKTPTGWAGVNTSLPNQLIFEAWELGQIADWHPFKAAQREYKISKESRLDLVLAPTSQDLQEKKNLHYIEIKNVTYADNATASFPDAETVRGQKHLLELMRLKTEGHGAEIVFVIQREGCTAFAPADAIDAEYGRLLRQAVNQGVKVRALSCRIDPLVGIHIDPAELPLRL